MNYLWSTLEDRGHTGEPAILCTCVLVWEGNTDRGERGRARCWRPASCSLLWTERFAPVSTMRYWTTSPETPGRPVQFPEAPPVLCSLWEERGMGVTEARHATSDVTRLQMICRIYPWHRKCSCPWWQHLEGQREEKQPLCGSARLGHTEAVQASLADGPMTSW